MDILDFNEKSQEYLANLFSQTNFNVTDQNYFITFDNKATLNDIDYTYYNYNRITGYEPDNKEKMPVLYTFFILEPPNKIKKKFNNELNKKNKGKKHDDNIIADYYMPMVPARPDFIEFRKHLINILENAAWKGKGYKFQFHLACLTRGNDFALIFIEVNSIKKILDKYKGKNIPFEILNRYKSK